MSKCVFRSHPAGFDAGMSVPERGEAGVPAMPAPPPAAFRRIWDNADGAEANLHRVVRSRLRGAGNDIP